MASKCCPQAFFVLFLVWQLPLSAKLGTDVDGSGAPFWLSIFGASPWQFAGVSMTLRSSPRTWKESGIAFSFRSGKALGLHPRPFADLRLRRTCRPQKK